MMVLTAGRDGRIYWERCEMLSKAGGWPKIEEAARAVSSRVMYVRA
jgi:hypothetical protein